jgi:hypothetical protein
MRRTIPFLSEVATLLTRVAKTTVVQVSISQNGRQNSDLGGKI